MKKQILKAMAFVLFSICIFFLIGCTAGSENTKKYFITDPGAKVYITMSSGEEYKGELLTVNDSKMTLSIGERFSEEELLNSANQIKIICNHKISSIWILGEDNHLIGIAIGTGIGLAVGSAAGLIEADKSKGGFLSEGGQACLGGCLIGAVGGLVGLIFGSASSTDDAEIYNYRSPKDYDFTQLKIYSRYGGSEPKFLKEIK